MVVLQQPEKDDSNGRTEQIGKHGEDANVAWLWSCKLPPTAHPLLMEHGNGSPKISLTLTVKEGYDPDWKRTVDKDETVDLEAQIAAADC